MSANEQHCELYLTLPHDPGADAAASLDGLLRDHEIACVLLRASTQGLIARSLGDELRDIADQHETAFLVENDLEAAIALEADGLHIGPDPDLLVRARAALPQDAQIGVSCGVQRHLAMEMGELGADYVALGKERTSQGDASMEVLGAIIDWWTEIFVLPCVAWELNTVEDAIACAEQGADFVALRQDLWSSPDALSAMIAELDASFARARDAA